MTIENAAAPNPPILSYIKDLPNICSLAGLGCSLLAIYFLIIGLYPAAMIGMIWAVGFDWADGLIVSTPTGSTGYSMSCNGPILFPDAASFVITPVAPHNLNVRPIVIPDTNVVSFEIEGRADQFICALDARKEIVDKTVQLAIRKEQFCVNLVRLNENSFLSTLRTKLTWGLDKRN